MTTRNLRPLNILRYTNRKLYAVGAGYQSLRDIREAVRLGRRVTVTERATGEDITDCIMASIVAHDAWARTIPSGVCYAFAQSYITEAACSLF